MGEATFVILVVIDLVDSTKFFQRFGDRQASEAMRVYDRIFRGLLVKYNGIEIDKTDGALLIFETMREALTYTNEYHKMIEKHLRLKSRVGIHCGHVIMHSNSETFIKRGAKPVEVDGIHKNIAARIMSVASGGQTILSARAGEYAGGVKGSLLMADIGIWRMKGVIRPMQLYAAGDTPKRLKRPPESDKVKLVRPPRLTPKQFALRLLKVTTLWPYLGYCLWVSFQVMVVLESFGVIPTHIFIPVNNFFAWLWHHIKVDFSG